MARAGRENFPVALRALPDSLRRHLQAIYGYARLTDNLGDEYPGDRLDALDWLERQLDKLFAGDASHPVFSALLPTVEAFELSRTPFDRLLAANRMDQHKKSYANWDELMEYCRLSANPVGHLVLAVFESATDDRLAASDAVCSGLQVLEHLQDLGEDARAGRIYMPADDMKRFGCTPGDLLAPTTGERLRMLVAHQVGRTRVMVEKGGSLVASLRGYHRLAVAGFVAGGLAGLDAISAARFDVLGGTRQAGNLRLFRRFVPLYLGSVGRRRRTAR
ncbi:MAG: squalene synthase HpnC [bacterium]|nr:squalene synthase HpnC [bacterium]